MSFLVKVVALICPLLISDTTLLLQSCLSPWVLKFKHFLCHIIAYYDSFDSSVWTVKANIIGGSYVLFGEGSRPCLSLPHFWHNFTFSVVPLALSFKIQTYLCEGFDSRIWDLKCDITRGSNEWRQSPLFVPSSFLRELYFFSRLSRPEFQNLILLVPYDSLLGGLQFKSLSFKIRYQTRHLWAFWWRQSALSILSSFLTFSVIYLALRFKFQNFFFHMISYYEGFNSWVWAFKFYITRGSYQLFGKGSRPCLSFSHFWQSYSFSMVSLALSIKLQINRCHMIAYYDGFDSRVWALKSNMIRESYELFGEGSHLYLSPLYTPTFMKQS
jgi:hypothetical protein